MPLDNIHVSDFRFFENFFFRLAIRQLQKRGEGTSGGDPDIENRSTAVSAGAPSWMSSASRANITGSSATSSQSSSRDPKVPKWLKMGKGFSSHQTSLTLSLTIMFSPINPCESVFLAFVEKI